MEGVEWKMVAFLRDEQSKTKLGHFIVASVGHEIAESCGQSRISMEDKTLHLCAIDISTCAQGLVLAAFTRHIT